MQTCILCPGPSLSRLVSVPACDASIAVNRAATRFACDWWAVLDAPLISAIDDLIQGEPQLFTRAENRRTGAVTFEAVYPFPNAARSYFTLPGAMALAAHLGAKRIDIYGCDWAIGQSGIGGRAGVDADHSATRFERERQHYEQMREWLSRQGIEVTRHGLDG